MSLDGASAIVVGAGRVGSPAALYLAAAGVGRIGIVDRAEVDVGVADELLHFAPDAGVPKAANAAVKLGALNPDVAVDTYPVAFEAGNAEAIVTGADVVLDSVRSEDSPWLVNDACCAAGAPFVKALLSHSGGELVAVVPGRSACARCAFGDGLPEAPDAALPAAAAGVLGALQALAGLRLLAPGGEESDATLLSLDARTGEVSARRGERRADCPACADSAPASQSS